VEDGDDGAFWVMFHVKQRRFKIKKKIVLLFIGLVIAVANVFAETDPTRVFEASNDFTEIRAAFLVIKDISGLIRDIGIILCVPFLSILFLKIYKQYVSLLKEENAFLKETQYDRALKMISSQKEIYALERSFLENELNKLQSILTEKDKILNQITKNNDDIIIREQLLQERMEQIKIEEINLEKRKKNILNLDQLYNILFIDVEFVAEFKTMFFDSKYFSYYHYGGMNESVSFYRDFAAKLNKFGLATYEPYCDIMESGVSICLTEHGINLRELLFTENGINPKYKRLGS
jgi:hypothetical protein